MSYLISNLDLARALQLAGTVCNASIELRKNLPSRIYLQTCCLYFDAKLFFTNGLVSKKQSEPECNCEMAKGKNARNKEHEKEIFSLFSFHLILVALLHNFVIIRRQRKSFCHSN